MRVMGRISGQRLEDGIQDAREAGVEFLSAEGGEVLGALFALGDDAGVAEDFHVVGEGGLGEFALEGVAGLRSFCGHADDFEARGITQGAQDLGQGDFGDVGVGDVFHEMILGGNVKNL